MRSFFLPCQFSYPMGMNGIRLRCISNPHRDDDFFCLQIYSLPVPPERRSIPVTEVGEIEKAMRSIQVLSVHSRAELTRAA
eukprot:scaffold20970_cov120-Skeletonema_marinoi.AAC.1